METRVLTLFDDEFFPPEPPKEKPKKEKATKAAVSPAEGDAVIENPDETVGNQQESQMPGPSILQEEDIPATTFESERLVDDKIPVNEVVMVNDTDAAEYEHTEAIHENVMNEAEGKLSEPSIFQEEDMPVTVFESEWLVDDKIPVNEAVMVNDANVAEDGHTEAIHETVTNEAEGKLSEPFIFQEEDIPVTAFEQERLVDDKVPVNEAVMIHDTDAMEQRTAHEAINDEPGLLSRENNTKVDNEATVVKEELSIAATAPESVAPTIEADTNKELNQQILSELIQLDYTALMQKNYTFDLNNATVINKELPESKVEPVTDTEEEEEEVFEEITPLPEWNLEKKYYTIGEVAQLFSVNTSHIRFWTNEFKLRPRTTRKGDRLYSPKDIAELRLIHHLVKEKKHTIKGAREKLKAEKTGVNNKLDLKESLVQLRDTLLKIKEQL